MTAGFSFAEDLGGPFALAVAGLAVAALLLLVVELRARERPSFLAFVSGALGVVLFLGAVLRPARVAVKGTVVGPSVAVLVDRSRRLLIPVGKTTTRQAVAFDAVRAIGKHLGDARLSVYAFGEGPLVPLPAGAIPKGDQLSVDSDLLSALSALSDAPGERPRSVIVVSDGRLGSPAAGELKAEAFLRLGVPIHTVSVDARTPADASIRSIRAAGAAVAHQPLALTVEVGCGGGLSCGSVPVTVTELRSGVDSALLATGEAKIENGVGKVELDVTLDRAGARVVEVAIGAPDGDALPENNSRLLTFTVARDRVRLLHLAGRPTYDVRALRRWLKSDEAVDVVAFFILRESAQGEDDPNADEQELALIEFPVNELFTTHLASFDAIILQDIDAVRYKLTQHLPRLARYVESGGGLIMVGGPSSFAGGRYAQTPIDSVLPVAPVTSGADSDAAPFVPAYTPTGRVAPVTRELRDLLGEELPTMHGANRVGQARPGSIVVWQHPKLDAGGQPMPLLALGEAGDGRSIALAVDDTHELAFSEFGAKVAGRAYGALWDGLLGWLMRDPRYEAARAELVHACIAGEPSVLRITRLPGMDGPVDAWLEKLGSATKQEIHLSAPTAPGATLDVPVPPLEAGGYTARIRVGQAPPTRADFACERAGPAWSDSQPDPARLEAIARAAGGTAVTADDVTSLPVPASTEVAAERHVTPLLPSWAWALLASAMLGAHWVVRRRDGLV